MDVLLKEPAISILHSPGLRMSDVHPTRSLFLVQYYECIASLAIWDKNALESSCRVKKLKSFNLPDQDLLPGCRTVAECGHHQPFIVQCSKSGPKDETQMARTGYGWTQRYVFGCRMSAMLTIVIPWPYRYHRFQRVSKMPSRSVR